tara:strand:- start:25155 stop:25619 length:465 start_codon:yes stop_codon:yes gene_type:complete
MKKTIIILITVGILIGAYSLVNKQNEVPTAVSEEISTTSQESDGTTKTFSVQLFEQNGSGESGSAHITESNGKVSIILSLDGAPENVQPAHIHSGSCEELGGVEYPLVFPQNGTSETVLDTNLSSLLTKLPLAINVHKSPDEVGVFVSCGDIAG